MTCKTTINVSEDTFIVNNYERMYAMNVPVTTVIHTLWLYKRSVYSMRCTIDSSKSILYCIPVTPHTPPFFFRWPVNLINIKIQNKFLILFISFETVPIEMSNKLESNEMHGYDLSHIANNMTRLIPQLMRALGVSSDSESEWIMSTPMFLVNRNDYVSTNKLNNLHIRILIKIKQTISNYILIFRIKVPCL